VYALVLIRYRLPYEEVAKVTESHRAYLKQLKEKGVLLASGPLEPRFGGALLVRLPDEGDVRAALDKVRDGDPCWQKGVANYELLAWNVLTGREDLDRLE